MITRLQVRGFKSLLDVDVTLGPLTVFVGANGSGKTSVLEAIDLLAKILHTGSEGWKASRVLSRQGTAPVGVIVEMIREGANGRLEVALGEKSVELVGLRSDEEPQATTGMQLSSWGRNAVRSMSLYRLDAEAMAHAAYSDETSPKLAFHGGNLAAVLDAMQGEARERFDEIERRMIQFVPMLRRLRIKRARAQTLMNNLAVIGHQVAFDFENASDINAEDASEGTLLLLGLLTIIESKPPGDMTIMLDDLDRALHPKAQRELVGYLHELVRSRPGLQIIATTHSPYLVEYLEYEEVRAITQQADGTSVVASLADHPQAERWREEMSAGEFWSSVGESWVAAGRK
jgi:AAA15 family ATPase/GTPase